MQLFYHLCSDKPLLSGPAALRVLIPSDAPTNEEAAGTSHQLKTTSRLAADRLDMLPKAVRLDATALLSEKVKEIVTSPSTLFSGLEPTAARFAGVP
jgi:hypothetical protein